MHYRSIDTRQFPALVVVLGCAVVAAFTKSTTIKG